MNSITTLWIYFRTDLLLGWISNKERKKLVQINTTDCIPSARRSILSTPSSIGTIRYEPNELRDIGNRVKHANYMQLPCGSLRTIRDLRLNRKRSCNPLQNFDNIRRWKHKLGVDHSNLVQVPIQDSNGYRRTPIVNVATVNVQSIKHKEQA